MHTLNDLQKHLSCDTSTGILTWLPAGRKRKNGLLAGTESQGYLNIFVEGKKYGAHRVVWLFATGNWPSQDIDHINGIRNDNRIENLRDVSHAENMQGARKISPRNKTGVTGVRWDEKNRRYHAQRMFNGSRIFLGCFDTLEEAKTAYEVATPRSRLPRPKREHRK